jgi:hypothetical protein
MRTLEVAARKYLGVDLSVLPADVKRKQPIVPWTEAQRVRPSSSQLDNWFRQLAPSAVCLVGGAVSGNLEMIDFDLMAEWFEPWHKVVKAEAPELAARVVREKTQSSGKHVIYRCEVPVERNQALAQKEIEAPDGSPYSICGKELKPYRVGDKWCVLLTYIETRGEGGIFLCDPSPGYKLEQGDFENIAMISAQERSILFEAARSLNEYFPASEEWRSTPRDGGGNRPGDDFNRRGDLRPTLLKHGWRPSGQSKGELWRRPGKDFGSSASLKDNLFYIYTSNASPLQQGKAYSAFHVYAVWEHGGDHAAAAKALALAGYGEQSSSVVADPANSAAPPPEGGDAVCDAQSPDSAKPKSGAEKKKPRYVPRDERSILVNPGFTQVRDTLREVTDRILNAQTCYSRADNLVVIRGDNITQVLTSNELAGLFNEYAEFFMFDQSGHGQYKPLPPAYANTWLNQFEQRSRLPIVEMFTRNPVYTKDFRLLEPGYDPQSRIYYAGPLIRPRSDTSYLDVLLKDFCFQTEGDRTNYLAVLLTAVLIPHFIGSKPAALFNGNQPELGKSILAQIISILRDGRMAETATYNPNDEEFEKRLCAIVLGGATTIIIDNAKAKGRNARLDSACLERLLTDPILSFRLLGKSASVRAENSHIFCITANAPDISRDLVTRSVVINLFLEGSPDNRVFAIQNPEEFAREHREILLGELLGMVERWKKAGKPLANVHSRFNKCGWGNIIGGILDVNGRSGFLANAQHAATQLDDTRRDFNELVAQLVDHPQGIWTATELADFTQSRGLLPVDLGQGHARSLATKMGTIAGRFINEKFALEDGRVAMFARDEGRKTRLYKVVLLSGAPDLEASAGPMPDLKNF